MANETINGTLFVTDKIGIGINEPNEPNAQLHILSSTVAPSQAFLESGGALLKLSVDASSASIGTANAFPLSIQTDGTPRISINSTGSVDISAPLSVQNTLTISGNVGIGTTASNHKLAIAAGDINIDDGRALRQAGRWIIGGDSNVLSIGSSNAPDGRDIRFDPGFAGALTIKKDTGNVGIGTTNPTYKLEVVGDVKASSIHSKPKVFEFKVEGDFDKFYPIVFHDDTWWEGPIILEINRPSIHTDSTSRGSLNSRFTTHSSWWGNGANFCRSEIYSLGNQFIAGYENYYFIGRFVIWLRGGGTTYFWRSNHFVSLEDYSAKEKIVKYNNDDRTAVTYPVKTNIESYVLNNGISFDQNFVVQGNVGIGTTSPAARLHIHSNDNDALKITNTALLKTARMGVDQLGVWIEPSETNSSIRLNANPGLLGLYVRGTDGNVGIGTTSPGAKLDVKGNLFVQAEVRADGGFQVDGQTVIDADAGWHRSYGNTGWYNGTHGGGWYMEDSTWIRSYGGKNVYHNTGILRTDGTLQVGPDGNRFVVNTSGNVGIGTTAPAARLQISDGFRGSLKLLSTSGVGHDFGYDGGGDSLFWFTHYGAENGETRFRWDNGTSARDLLLIKNTGNVGIGTTNPSFGLDVRGNNHWIGSGDSSQSQGGWRLGRWPDYSPNEWVYLTRADSTKYQDLAVGALWAGGTLRFGTADDLAEMTPVKAEDNLEPGDVVVIENPLDNRVLLARSNKPYDSKVAGVISDTSTAGLIIGGSHPTDVNRDDIKPLALAGRVLTKVTTENGSINAGDFLTTSSTPGHAMKAIVSGHTLGKALQSFNDDQNGENKEKIWVLVNLGMI